MNLKLLWPVVIIALFVGFAEAEESPSLEYRVKAAFLYRFADYVNWPSSAFESASSPFTICLIGGDPFGSMLDKLAAGERLAGRPIVIKRAQSLPESSGCQVAYVGRKVDLSTLLYLQGKPVLTVTDGVDEAGPHGIINFVLRDNRVRFDIDMGIARANGLTISSRLLSLALIVFHPDDAKSSSL